MEEAADRHLQYMCVLRKEYDAVCFLSCPKKETLRALLTLPDNLAKDVLAAQTDKACPICLEEPKVPVVTVCVHAFCKGCLNKHLEASFKHPLFTLKHLQAHLKCL